MRTVFSAGELNAVWAEEYRRVAHEVARRIPRDRVRLLELGGGAGQLTVPLALALPDASVVVLDRFARPYASARTELRRRLAAAGLAERVRVLAGDVVGELRRGRSGRYDGVVSSEFLPELTSPSVAAVLRGCYRELSGGGVTVHAFLSPSARTDGQRLTVEADSNPRWSRTPPVEWFSPSTGFVRGELARAGFSGLRLRHLPSRVRFSGPAARRQLRRWGVRRSFERAFRRELVSVGLELPDWVIVSGRRAGTPEQRRLRPTS